MDIKRWGVETYWNIIKREIDKETIGAVRLVLVSGKLNWYNIDEIQEVNKLVEESSVIEVIEYK